MILSPEHPENTSARFWRQINEILYKSSRKEYNAILDTNVLNDYNQEKEVLEKAYTILESAEW